jgi:hypothetical protein
MLGRYLHERQTEARGHRSEANRAACLDFSAIDPEDMRGSEPAWVRAPASRAGHRQTGRAVMQDGCPPFLIFSADGRERFDILAVSAV